MKGYALILLFASAFQFSFGQEIPAESFFYLMRLPGAIVPTPEGPQSLCEGESGVFEITNPGMDETIVWEASGDAQFIYQDDARVKFSFPKAGLYTLTAKRLTVWGDGAASLTVTVHPRPSIELGQDTTICAGGSMLLRAPLGLRSYQWQDQSTTDSLRITASGTYWVMVEDTLGCRSQDILRVEVADVPVPDLGQDLPTCTGQKYDFSPGVFATYLWQDGSEKPQFRTDKSGLYWVEVTNICGKKARDSVRVKKWNGPKLDLGKNVFFCTGDTVSLDAGGDFATYRWQDGSVKQNIKVYESGVYRVEVKDKAGCVFIDSATFEVEACLTDLGLPLAFTPNGDGLNDIFKPLSLKNIQRMAIQIYDPAGTLVYLSNSNKAAWNGKFQGGKLPAGEYRYSIQYQKLNGKPQFDAGTVKMK